MDAFGDVASAEIDVTWSGGGAATPFLVSASTTRATYTVTIPASVDFSTINIGCSTASGGDGGTGDGATSTMRVYDLYLDT